MSLIVTRTNIKGWFNTADKPTEANFHALIDAMVMNYAETSSLVADTDLVVTHGNAKKATHVTVLDANGESIEVSWKHTPSNETNAVTINCAFAVPNAQINVLC